MAAPTPNVTRTANAAARMLEDGFGTLIVLDIDPNIEFEEQEVTPFGLVLPDFMDRTTNHNTAVQTKSPSRIPEVTPIEAVVAYDPMVLDAILAAIGVNTTCTIVFYPNGDAWATYAALKEFRPNSMTKNNKPMANIVIVPTCIDPSDCSEAAPVFLAGAGTAC